MHAIGLLVVLAIGFGIGRLKHPAKLKLAAVEAELSKIETELKLDVFVAHADVRNVISRITNLL